MRSDEEEGAGERQEAVPATGLGAARRCPEPAGGPAAQRNGQGRTEDVEQSRRWRQDSPVGKIGQQTVADMAAQDSWCFGRESVEAAIAASRA